ncbi:M48 family metalloprotease [Psychromonas aquimarina]|uniref:M48 family metalloprotease n=1 Tax=Psychromonas aquimarina TaxID=444919 RepID=UPI0003FF8602|nr:M48 family metalloprotease [Psychromonas aquimarina]
MELIYKHEKPLFITAAVLSAVFWLMLTIGTFGLVFIYLLTAYLFFLFAHSAFISHLKGAGVKISEQQYPDLYKKLVEGCTKVGLSEIPEAYLLRTGYFNALATKFLGRHFVVLFTDVIDALEQQPGALDFYIGHELGHIHRKHLSRRAFIMPASILPVIGSALYRAQEYTCDRYGVACCQCEDDIKAAIAAMAAGDTRWQSINLQAYLSQINETSGFWMSFNELNSDYPWLTKRMAAALALSKGEEIKHPSRHAAAWLLSLFIPRFGMGASGAGGLIIVAAIIGILAAVAIPAYQKYADDVQAYAPMNPVNEQVVDYVDSRNGASVQRVSDNKAAVLIINS